MKIHNLEFFMDRVVGSKKDELEKILHSSAEKIQCIEIDKKNGKRRIYYLEKDAVKNKFETVQKRLLKNFLSKIPLPTVAKGFRKESSYNQYLAEHIGNKYFLHLDIKGFFDSITEEQIRDSLSDLVSDEEAMDYIIAICMLQEEEKRIVPQGWITSPCISNIIFRKLDQCILKYCQSIHKIEGKPVEIAYTRYADDLMFSSDGFDFQNYVYFQKKIMYILKCNGFQCNKRKTISSKNVISLGGYVVGQDVHLSNKKLKTINTLIYFFDGRKNCMSNETYEVDKVKTRNKEIYKNINSMMIKQNGKELNFKSNENIIQFLNGYRAFLISIVKVNGSGTTIVSKLENTISKIEKISSALQENEIR